MHQDPDVDIGESYAPVGGEILVKMENEVKQKRLYTREPKDVAKIDVGSMNTEEIDKRMRELYERTDDGWSCLVCDHTNKGKSSNIRNHVEIHMDGFSVHLRFMQKGVTVKNHLKESQNVISQK